MASHGVRSGGARDWTQNAATWAKMGHHVVHMTQHAQARDSHAAIRVVCQPCSDIRRKTATSLMSMLQGTMHNHGASLPWGNVALACELLRAGREPHRAHSKTEPHCNSWTLSSRQAPTPRHAGQHKRCNGLMHVPPRPGSARGPYKTASQASLVTPCCRWPPRPPTGAVPPRVGAAARQHCCPSPNQP